jgi:hypothetical protein
MADDSNMVVSAVQRGNKMIGGEVVVTPLVLIPGRAAPGERIQPCCLPVRLNLVPVPGHVPVVSPADRVMVSVVQGASLSGYTGRVSFPEEHAPGEAVRGSLLVGNDFADVGLGLLCC